MESVTELMAWSQYDHQAEIPIAHPDHWSPLQGVVTTSAQSARGSIIRLMKNDAVLELDHSQLRETQCELQIFDLDGQLQFSTMATIHWTNQHDRFVGLFLEHDAPLTLRDQIEFEKRQQVRFPLNVPASVWWSGDNESQDVFIRDYSRDGLAIETPNPVDVGVRMLLSFVGDESRPVMVAGRVCWQMKSCKRFLVGCSLDAGHGQRIRSQPSPTS